MESQDISKIEELFSQDIELFFPGANVRKLFNCAPPGYLIVRFKINMVTGKIIENSTFMEYHTGNKNSLGQPNSSGPVPGGPVPPCVPKVSSVIDLFGVDEIQIDEKCGAAIRTMFNIPEGESFL